MRRNLRTLCTSKAASYSDCIIVTVFPPNSWWLISIITLFLVLEMIEVWRRIQVFSSIWGTSRRQWVMENGMLLRSIYQGSQRLKITVTPWKFSSRSESRSTLKPSISTLYMFIFTFGVQETWWPENNVYVPARLIYCIFYGRGDHAKAVEILAKDLKVFSTFNEDLFKEITMLLTLQNFRYPFWSVDLDDNFLETYSEFDDIIFPLILCVRLLVSVVLVVVQ